MYGRASEPTISYVFSGLFSHLCFLRVFSEILQESADGVSSEASFLESLGERKRVQARQHFGSPAWCLLIPSGRTLSELLHFTEPVFAFLNRGREGSCLGVAVQRRSRALAPGF